MIIQGVENAREAFIADNRLLQTKQGFSDEHGFAQPKFKFKANTHVKWMYARVRF